MNTNRISSKYVMRTKLATPAPDCKTMFSDTSSANGIYPQCDTPQCTNGKSCGKLAKNRGAYIGCLIPKIPPIATKPSCLVLGGSTSTCENILFPKSITCQSNITPPPPVT